MISRKRAARVRGRSHNAIMCASLNMSPMESKGASLKAPSGILRHTVKLSNQSDVVREKFDQKRTNPVIMRKTPTPPMQLEWG